MYTDHQGTDDQCALMISVAPAVPAVSAEQCHVPVSAIYQCQSCLVPVPPNSGSQCCLSVPYMSDACQCPSVPPISAHHCSLISAHQ
ncbi:unnamed protein product [Staurois parvus]|uniref:Uncharacterized protein n=1 Tax=Staurois parvus TaxID=386267 RepID=A0ABN9DNB4_9NEOB|nr:unnamed protein product [Staurois parvus]